MKKSTKIVLGIGIGASLIGAGLTAAGLAGGGLSQLQSYYDNKEKHDSHFYTKTVEILTKLILIRQCTMSSSPKQTVINQASHTQIIQNFVFLIK